MANKKVLAGRAAKKEAQERAEKLLDFCEKNNAAVFDISIIGRTRDIRVILRRKGGDAPLSMAKLRS